MYNNSTNSSSVYDYKSIYNNHDNALVRGYYTFEEIGGGGGRGGGKAEGVRDFFGKNDLLLLDLVHFSFLCILLIYFLKVLFLLSPPSDSFPQEPSPSSSPLDAFKNFPLTSLFALSFTLLLIIPSVLYRWFWPRAQPRATPFPSSLLLSPTFPPVKRPRSPLPKKRGGKKENNSEEGTKVEEKKKGVVEVYDENIVVKLGRLTVFKTVLGYGSSGTIVFEGEYDKRRVAIKRILKAFCNLAEREVEMLIEIDSSPHVLRYYAKEADSEFVYLVLAYCPLNLKSLVESKFVDGGVKGGERGEEGERVSTEGLELVDGWSGSFEARLGLVADIFRGSRI